ncbi:putative uncharacterized protein DDB_G0282133 [Oppia nitens]|uniref:putative uncharacterized protein DDB_G0282133 n=1 Tax=Oppia nitens TaxID=1686743 RepID=UPI0023DBDB5E|nr:putative uncharacterized protein DDB_G0282133 [Oppia nitens]
MGNHSSGFNKTFVTNSGHNVKDSKRPHSVLGITDEDDNRCNFKAAILRSHISQNKNNNIKDINGKIGGKCGRPPGMQLPPLPRSHSFHQVLRPTENGQILAAKGTIRGLEFNKPLTNNTKCSPIADELKAILNSRRCKSETDLAVDNSSSSHDSNHSESSNYEESSNKRKEFNGLRKSSASNGVKAKIQRHKYRAPQPPQPLNSNNGNHNGDLSSTTTINNNNNSNSANHNSLSSYESSNLTDSHKKSATTSTTICEQKHSEKSYNNNRISCEDSSKYFIIPRLKLTGHPTDPGINGSGSANSGGSHTNSTGANHVMPSKYQSRNIIFDSKNNNFNGFNSALQTSQAVKTNDCSQDYRKVKRSSHIKQNQLND